LSGCDDFAGLKCFGCRVFYKGSGIGRFSGRGFAEGVEFETIYGKGAILIQWDDIEMIRSDKEFLILYSEAEEAIGRIWGLENGNLMVGQGLATASYVPVSQIHRSITRDQYDKSRLEWLRARLSLLEREL
jgi:hypothetical protein